MIRRAPAFGHAGHALGGYGILRRVRRYRHLLFLGLILVTSLACQAAMRLISPPTPLPAASAEPPLAATQTVVPPTVEAVCPSEMESVLLEANNEHLPLGQFPTVDTGASIVIPLVTYRINGDKLSAPALAQVPNDLVPYQREFDVQRSVWTLFTTLIPEDQRTMLAEFQVMTDGPGGVLSAVEQTNDDPAKWILETDIADIPDRKNLVFTLLHEFGHLLTLNSSQVPPDLQVFNNPESTRVLNRATAACPNYFPGEGCSLPGSYLNVFFDRYWTDLYHEWSLIEAIGDDERRDARLHAFYHKYNDRFVDSYAVTSPVEDIAETWAYFVLSPRPTDSTEASQKINFFYEYPVLARLRDHILAGLCAAKP